MPDTQEIHIHLTPPPGTTVHITIADGSITMASGNAGTSIRGQVATTDDVLAEAIRRLESSGTSPNIREAADGLLAMGYVLKLPKTTPSKRPENYLRIMDPRYTAHGIGYLTPSAFSFSRTSDRARLASLPGATPISNAINFPHIHSAQAGLDAAQLLKS